MLLYQESSLQSPRSPQTSTRDGCHQEVLHHAAPYTIWNHAYHRFQMHIAQLSNASFLLPPKKFTFKQCQCFTGSANSRFVFSLASCSEKWILQRTWYRSLMSSTYPYKMGMFGTRSMYMRASNPWGRAASPAHDTPCFARTWKVPRLPTQDHCHVHLKYLKPAHKRPSGQGGRCTQLVPCCLCASWGYSDIPVEHGFVKMEQSVAFASADNFQTAGSMADCAGALDPISDRRRGDGWAWEASIIMIRPSSSLIRGSILCLQQSSDLFS